MWFHLTQEVPEPTDAAPGPCRRQQAGAQLVNQDSAHCRWAGEARASLSFSLSACYRDTEAQEGALTAGLHREQQSSRRRVPGGLPGGGDMEPGCRDGEGRDRVLRRPGSAQGIRDGSLSLGVGLSREKREP